MKAIVLAVLAVLAGGAVAGPGEFADRGVLLLTFDDPNYDRWVKHIPLFEKYGAHVSFFPYGPLEGSALGKMAALHRAGHTVGTHTLDHVNVPDYLKEHDEETFWRTQILPHIRSYARVGIEVQSFAYPNGRRTKETDEMLLRRGIRRIRGCGDGIHRVTFYDRDGTRAAEWKPIACNDWAYNRMEDLANSRVFFGATVGEAYHSDIDDLCAAIRRAARENKVLQFTSHDIAPDAKHINMKAEWLERILATAKEEGVRMIGYDELPSESRDSLSVVTNAVGLVASDGWKIVNYQDKLKIAFDGKTLSVSGDKKGDTAWSVTSRALPIAAGTKEIMVGAEIRSTRGMRNQNAAADHTCKIVWSDADGRTVGQSPLRLPCPSSTRPVGVADVIPVADGASAFSIQLGFDRPDLSADDSLVFSDMVYACYPQAGIAKTRLDIPDLHVPTVEAVGPGRFRIADGSGIVPSSVTISVDGRPLSCTEPEGDVWTVGDGTWSEGLHVAEIAVSNRIGNATVERRAFYVGKVPDVEKVTLRDDGMTLVGGKPFFPIGAYHVRRHSCNGKDLDRAFDELKSMGFNFAHTYDKVDSGEFLDTAARHGFKLFVLSRDEETNATFLARTRFHPAVLAWYLADDTSDNTTPERLRFLDSVAKALDPSRLTCQADGTFFRGLEKAGFSRYSNYVTGSDVFMPEIYPVRNDTKTDTHRTCVATVRRDMRLVKHDIATRADGKPKAIWPILQAFSGWERWNEFPTSRELYATTFAALAEGAQGMTWYTYCGSGKNVGFARTPELVARMKAVSQRIAELSPVLVERSVEGLKVDVLNGPKADPLGHPPVVALLKRHGGSCWIIAVNSSPEQVSARFALPSAKDAAVAKVRWEDRTVSVADGMFSDSFDGFGVHVYEIPAEGVE